ncbi:ArsR/SmtB family transcription factor [Micromonospora peucetia]|uniref:Helix-turn-helix domain-containing protein n=1 Tax=Micromonospora peucetia TaxID=47871 RepID=A0A1C6TZ39_9ACTN|nr:helix-turn-helix domain-containing protein [Micromonospora peucetia]WSA33139.1 helix-turn-helix domain-containing protein [Micromonospora peucetia]SCL46891.1 Helix-turn-helix domain-containing protein [Micromonospora peucetia]
MTIFRVDADVLARARFGTSQLAESVAALSILMRPRPLPWHQAWRDTHLPAFREYLADDPVTGALVAHAVSPVWIADFLTVPPAHSDLTIDEELVELATVSDTRIRADLERVRQPLPAQLTAPGLAERAVALVRWLWDRSIAPEWPRRKRLLRADVVSRINRLASEGWEGVVRDMRPGMRWLGGGELQIDELPQERYNLRGRDLAFYATHCRGGWVSWRLPHRFGIIYPVTGIFTGAEDATPRSLVRLLGAARAAVLQHTAEPVSTSGLVGATGMPLGTVGHHLQVLLEAGMLHRRRSGREVFYWWTDTARALVAGSTST